MWMYRYVSNPSVCGNVWETASGVLAWGGKDAGVCLGVLLSWQLSTRFCIGGSPRYRLPVGKSVVLFCVSVAGLWLV